MTPVYDEFAEDFHHKRKRPWRAFTEFLTLLSEKGYRFSGTLIDLGCANGRHVFTLKNNSNRIIGIDNSIDLLRIARESFKDKEFSSKKNAKNIVLLLADMRCLPIRENSIDHLFSIASVHHIRGSNARKKVLDFIHTLMKSDGYLIMSVWRRWQRKFRSYFLKDKLKRIFMPGFQKKEGKRGLPESGDKYISWTVSKRNETYNRYYHFFTRKEVKDLLHIFKIEILKAMGGPGKKDNFFLLAQK
ncbi:MAG: class I SAM-dependent methyltransferase [Promethearchaeota archaeon]|nr:MAG: class I SAM-dependent methyltransferase [Candidatus Lokiarchaeota archaeon]